MHPLIKNDHKMALERLCLTIIFKLNKLFRDYLYATELYESPIYSSLGPKMAPILAKITQLSPQKFNSCPITYG